jgi:hypothetical protein
LILKSAFHKGIIRASLWNHFHAQSIWLLYNQLLGARSLIGCAGAYESDRVFSENASGAHQDRPTYDYTIPSAASSSSTSSARLPIPSLDHS